MSRNQYLLRYEEVSFLVSTLNDQLLGSVVLPNRQTGGVYHRLLASDSPVLLELNASSSTAVHVVRA